MRGLARVRRSLGDVRRDTGADGTVFGRERIASIEVAVAEEVELAARMSRDLAALEQAVFRLVADELDRAPGTSDAPDTHA